MRVARWMLAAALATGASAQDDALAPPTFHHIQLNSVDPARAIAFYTRLFPSTVATIWAGMPALRSPDGVLVVFHKVAKSPKADPLATAYWHFGWSVTDARASLKRFAAEKGLLAPFYTGEGDAFVGISSDTYPYPPGVPGRTRAQLAEAKAQGLAPRGVAGNGYVFGPDGAVIEFTGDAPAERVDHVHMWQEAPLCAQLWYQAHLGGTPRRLAPGASPLTAADCRVARGADRSWPSLAPAGTFRAPAGGVVFGTVTLNWYPDQTDAPLGDTRGHLIDHVALAVADLDAWNAKLRAEKVRILAPMHRLGETRALLIEGPSREAIELVEIH